MVEVLEFSETEDGRLFATLKVEDSVALDLDDIVQIDGEECRIIGIGMVPPESYANGLVLVSTKPIPEQEGAE